MPVNSLSNVWFAPDKVRCYVPFAEYALFPPQSFVTENNAVPDRQPAVDRPPQRHVGVFGGGAPPLPFPNRVVKPASADGTWLDSQGE